MAPNHDLAASMLDVQNNIAEHLGIMVAGVQSIASLASILEASAASVVAAAKSLADSAKSLAASAAIIAEAYPE